MTVIKYTHIFIILCLLCVHVVLAQDDDLIPQGLIIEDHYMPGMGTPIGQVMIVQGEVIIIHESILKGYRATNQMKLYKGDTLIARSKGRLSIQLNDNSILSLGSESKLTLNKVMIDPVSKTRSSFMNLPSGRVRFGVKRMKNYKSSDFKVKTPTALVGVRGSDFVIYSTAQKTEVTTFEDTRLELISLAAPDAKPTFLENFERVVVEQGQLPSEIEKVSHEEIKTMKESFLFDIQGTKLVPTIKEPKKDDATNTHDTQPQSKDHLIESKTKESDQRNHDHQKPISTDFENNQKGQQDGTIKPQTEPFLTDQPFQDRPPIDDMQDRPPIHDFNDEPIVLPSESIYEPDSFKTDYFIKSEEDAIMPASEPLIPHKPLDDQLLTIPEEKRDDILQLPDFPEKPSINP